MRVNWLDHSLDRARAHHFYTSMRCGAVRCLSSVLCAHVFHQNTYHIDFQCIFSLLRSLPFSHEPWAISISFRHSRHIWVRACVIKETVLHSVARAERPKGLPALFTLCMCAKGQTNGRIYEPKHFSTNMYVRNADTLTTTHRHAWYSHIFKWK